MISFSIALALAAAVTPPFNSGTDRGVFVYGTLVLDFVRGWEVRGRTHRLVNCSTETMYCADGELFNIVLPRFCSDIDIRPGTSWRLGDLETTVLGSERVDVLHPPGTHYQLYYVHTNARPDIVYAYSPNRGVIRLYYDIRHDFAPDEAVDFVAIARRGELGAYARTDEARRRNLSRGLLTLDQFAACLSEEFRRNGRGEAAGG